MFEKRRGELIYLLKNRKEEIDLSRQHQIYGAVKEIELFLETIHYFEDLAHKEELERIVLPRPEKKQSFLAEMRDTVKTRLLE